ncbi:cytochrome P450 monooxygenase-like protein [Periconia macrospinosa]|uniref:Cytochrome P450 monooxygenase-like protein n=1 Tax=Periconia macrospinosa TaxID=97972 RepID=A0A2V1D0N8_9PLEO|nr:cytochrome P450 monooxygenase-like protein [Periconia macrospinosa]
MLTPTTGSILIIATIGLILLNRKSSNVPLANPPSTFGLRILKQFDFFQNGMQIYNSSRKKFAGKPFRLLTGLGDVIILPPRFAHTIRNNENLSFSKAAFNDFHGTVPGFDPIGIIDHDGQVLQGLARKQLTKHLNTVTEPLSAEATYATRFVFGDSSEWKDAVLQESILTLVARLSSRIFLGEELCRNEDWLDITKNYTVNAFKAAVMMTVVPSFLKPLLPYVSKDCKEVRAQRDRAREIIKPVIEKRRALKEKARLAGQPIPVLNDALEWGEQEHNGVSYNPADLQLVLSFAAIHTTTDLTMSTLLLLANKPDEVRELREEMVRVLKAEGWRKSALFNMKLLDSALKETQRLKPNDMLGMRRVALKDVTLDENIFVPKGQYTMVDSWPMMDPSIYPDPEKYDIHRFLRMRETPGGSNKAQLVSTSPDHIAFGHGMHACPGRFFAANEIKIALCHLLLKYDWELAPGSNADPVVSGTAYYVNPETRVRFRRRKEEIDLESLEFN